MNLFFKKIFFLSCVIVVLINLASCEKKNKIIELYASEDLMIQQVSAQSYVHISYLNTDTYGKVPCNGMVFIDHNEAIVFDTPTSDKTSIELINWIEKELNAKVKTVVTSHFHIDAAGGFEAFHENGVISYANEETIKLMKAGEGSVPQYGIKSCYKHSIGDKQLFSIFVGEAHSQDNIVGYFSSDKVLFGGCMIKEIGAGKGNLEDANMVEWPNTIDKLKVLIPDAEIIVPGHGKVGGRELLDYTIEKVKSTE